MTSIIDSTKDYLLEQEQEIEEEQRRIEQDENARQVQREESGEVER